MVFGPTSPGVYGPAPSLLGPALFRVNAILPAVATSFEFAEAGLRQELALGRAINLVGEEGVNLDNLLAAGATFDEIAAETQFRQSTLSWHQGLTEGLAADPDFVAAAQDLTEGADPFPVTLADGSIVLMRLDGITEPALRPFEDVKDQAMAAQKAASETAAIAAFADTIKAEVSAGKTTARGRDVARVLIVQANQTLTRASNMDNAPADLKDRLFALDLQSVDLVSGPGPRGSGATHRQSTPFDAAAEANQAMLAEAATNWPAS